MSIKLASLQIIWFIANISIIYLKKCKRISVKSLFVFMSFTTLSFSSEYYYDYGKKVNLTKVLKKREKSSSEVEYYARENGKIIGVTKKIIVKCVDNDSCLKTINKYDVLSVSKLTDSLFLVKLSKDKNVFECSQKLHNDENVQYAIPNFVRKLKPR